MSNITASNNEATTKTLVVDFSGPKKLYPEPVLGLFDVEVYGLREFALIPKNDLARELASTWLQGDLKATLCLVGVREPTPGQQNAWQKRNNVTRLAIRLDVPALITDKGDPFETARAISAEERTVALAAIEAHRAAKRPKARVRKRRA